MVTPRKPQRRILANPEPANLPPVTTRPFKSEPRYRYKRLLDRVREHPGAWFIIARYEGPTVEDTGRRSRYDYTEMRRWLDNHWPLEHWEVVTRRTPDTWAERCLYVRYLGELSEIEAQRLRSTRRARYEERMRRGIRRRADNEAQSRMRSIRDAEESRRDAARRH